MDNRQIVFTKINTAELLKTEIRKPKAGEVLVKTEISTISAGTEKANIMGNPNISVFSEGNEPVEFPRYAGYSSSGTVIEVGEGVKDLCVGDRVVMSWSNHELYNTIPESNAVKIEYECMSMQAAALCHIGVFSLAAVRKCALEVGESMLVMGLGVLGLLGVSFAKSAGAVPLIVADPVKARRERALECGADYALDPFDKDFVKKVKELSGGGVHTAIEVTGSGTAFNQCLDCMRPLGRIALLGCIRDKNFTVDYYRKIHGPGITVVGAHTSARPKNESYPHYFTQQDDIQTIIKLSSFGRINIEKMVDALYSPLECKEIYTELIKNGDFPPVVQFDWSKIE